MQGNIIHPGERLKRKYFIIAALAYGIPAIVVLIFFLALMVHHGIGLGERQGVVFFSVFGISSAALWILLAALIPAYFRSISYEVTDREIIVRKGILTRAMKTVPCRTITNIVEERDLIDRYWVNLGSVKIQTAGMSGQAGYEASLDGLEDWGAVNREIQDRLRAFRGPMAPTAAEVEPGGEQRVFSEILRELRAIRRALNEKP
jgi:membrane protein YdbS with pleckstrin-like domain